MHDTPMLPQPTPPNYAEPRIEQKPAEPTSSTGGKLLEDSVVKVRRRTIRGQIDGD